MNDIDHFDFLAGEAERERASEEAERQHAAVTREVKIDDWFSTAPGWLRHVVAQAGRWHSVRWHVESRDDDDGPEIPFQDDGRMPASHIADAEALSSQLVNYPERYDHGQSKQHLLMLDIDHAAVLMPSSTAGHSHLVINHRLDDDAWREIITVLGKHGVIEDGYAAASLRRGATFIRAPWVRKGFEKFDRVAAYSRWLDEPDKTDFTNFQAWPEWMRKNRPEDPDKDPF